MQAIPFPEIAPQSSKTTQDYAYDRLRNAIMLGTVRPGTALTIRGLAQHFELSPTPIREAVRRLSSESAIEVLGNRRLRVPEMTIGKFEELVQLRIALEVHAAERAFPYISEVAIEQMRVLDDAMDAAIAAQDFESLTRMNQQFHGLLYGLNPFQSVMPMIESLWLQLGPFQRQVIDSLDGFGAVDRHKEMLAAMRARDRVALSVAIEGDIRDGSERAGRDMLRRAALEKRP